MNSVNQNNPTCCTLCPAMCRLELGWGAPDIPAIEYPTEAGAGLCPRGSALGELLGSPYRLRWPVDIAAAAERMTGDATVLIDGNLPLEEIAAAAEIVASWDGVQLCCVVAPEDEQLLLGIESAGAAYLSDEDLTGCDGFVVVGDAFAANPRCARGVMDALAQHRRAPLVVIDTGGGVTLKFATRRITCRPSAEADALVGDEVASAVEGCKRLGVIISAEPGRGGIWRRVGKQAGELAKSHGGGVSAQTIGANALAAVRVREHLGLISLAEAMKSDNGVRVSLGVDSLGMFGWAGPAVAVAAAALSNQTTESAEVVLPVALACEMGGTFLHAGVRAVQTSALMPPPAGVPTVSELLRALAEAAGAKAPQFSGKLPPTDRITPAGATETSVSLPDGMVLVFARHAARHAEGSLSAHAGWQSQAMPLPEIRICPADAAEMGLADLAQVEVETESHKTIARLRVVRHVAPGTLAISESFPEARRLIPYVIDAGSDAVISGPAAVAVRAVEPAKAQQ